MKNLIIILGIVVVGAAGYYMYSQQGTGDLFFGQSRAIPDDVLNNTQKFMTRGALLESLEIETAVFRDPRFTSLRSFTTPVLERPVKRANPFDPAVNSGV